MKSIVCTVHADRMKEGRKAFKILTGVPTGKYLQEGVDLYRRKILQQIQKIGVNTRNWIDSAQDMDYWRALVNDALNLWGS